MPASPMIYFMSMLNMYSGSMQPSLIHVPKKNKKKIYKEPTLEAYIVKFLFLLGSQSNYSSKLT